MSRYLDPKSDVVFKKIFGEHPSLLKSFLNAVLPLSDDEKIESLEYLPAEQVPVIPDFKYTVVDVKCKDKQGRVFVVEMQIQWTRAFMQRLLFGTSTAYVKQLQPGEDYRLLQPVYGLSLVATIFDRESPTWYHHYKLVNIENSKKVIKDLQLIFVELPKFEASSFSDKKLQVLWLHFMAELNQNTKTVPEEWLAVPEIREAVGLSEEAAYTPGELETYEKYWKAVSSEKTLLGEARDDAKEEGIKEGMKKGVKKGAKETEIRIAKEMLAAGFSKEKIAQMTNLSIAELDSL